jgi:hypothetical protein
MVSILKFMKATKRFLQTARIVIQRKAGRHTNDMKPYTYLNANMRLSVTSHPLLVTVPAYFRQQIVGRSLNFEDETEFVISLLKAEIQLLLV